MIFNEFTNDELIEIFNNSNSKRKCLIKLGHEYETKHCNGIILDELLKHYANLINFDIELLNRNNKQKNIQEYLKNPNYCLYCGNIILYDRRNGKFCNNSCAASYNNKRRKHSDETKKKISESINKSEKFRIALKQKIFEYDFEKNAKIRKCVYCGKEYEVPKLKNGSYSEAKTCSKECNKLLMIQNGKKSYNKIKSEGRFVGWKSRNITSYPEKFFCKVLTNNNIDFQREKYIKQFHYFLDFVIEKNGKSIDLEIDGKQHKSRKSHDIIRDENLKSLNYIVYRIEWNSLNTKEGKELMKNKINDFIKFYNSL